MHHRRIAGLPGARTTLVITHPFRAPHQTISDVGLIGGRLVKNVARLSSQQAWLSRASASSYRGPIYKQAHTEEMWLVHPEALYRKEGLQAHVTSWRSDAIRSSSVF